MSRLAYLLTGDDDAAQDLVQSALVSLASHWQRVSAGGDPEAYLRRIMINRRNSWWHQRRDQPVAEVPERAGPDEAAASASRVTMAAALRTLAPRQRAVVVLRYYAGLSEAEAAESLGCSIGTVKSQSHDALARLRRVLGPINVDNREVVK